MAIQTRSLTRYSQSRDDDFEVLDSVLEDSRSKSAESLVTEADVLQCIFRRLDALSEREAAVIRMRFGFSPYQPMTLLEVSEQLGLTCKQTCRLQNLAMQKLTGEPI